MQKTIFVVDDNMTNLILAEKALEERYQVITLNSAEKMFAILEKVTPDLILLDVKMPVMDGFEAIHKLKTSKSFFDIPVIFLTASTNEEDEARGIELGAVDFIVKPFSEPVLLNRIRNHLNIDELIHERTEQLIQLQNGIVFTLADVVESRDSNTGGHIDRTTVYMKILIDAMVERGQYASGMRDWDMESVISSARLHDLGKIAIPDSILNKPDKLTSDEFDVIKTHPAAGEQFIDQMITRTGNADFLNSAKLFAAFHHERWDGKGYPFGLKEEDIPLQGRIMAIVDVYDALTSARPYKKAFSSDEAMEIIEKDTGTHFDPNVAGVFCSIKDEVEAELIKI